MTEDELAIVRRAYARQMVGRLGVENAGLEAAFAAVRREDFLGSDPWHLVSLSGIYRKLPANDPVYLYQDALFALQRDRGVNNGSPSLHAWLMHHFAPGIGDRVAHIGAGTGYYTAILAELVGPAGHVTAIEFDADLAGLAQVNLGAWSNVTVVRGDGAEWPVRPVDRIYVSFGVSRPAAPWIEQLALGGKLIFPLGVPVPSASPENSRHAARGAALLVEKHERGLAARSLGPAFFVLAEGALAEDAEARRLLFEAFEGGGIDLVKRLHWKEDVDPSQCWFRGPGWALSYGPGDCP